MQFWRRTNVVNFNHQSLSRKLATTATTLPLTESWEKQSFRCKAKRENLPPQQQLKYICIFSCAKKTTGFLTFGEVGVCDSMPGKWGTFDPIYGLWHRHLWPGQLFSFFPSVERQRHSCFLMSLRPTTSIPSSCSPLRFQVLKCHAN